MNWEALGAIGELVGAAAVIATLLYLATQIRQNNTSQRVAAKLEMTRQFSEFIDLMVLHPELATIHDRGLESKELTAEELTTFNRMMAKATWYFATMHFQYQIQKLEEGDWEESRSLIAFYCGTPGYQRFWASRERAHGPEFLQYVDNEIKKHTTTR